MRHIYVPDELADAAPGPRAAAEFSVPQELAHDVGHVGLVLPQRVAQVVLPYQDADLAEYVRPVTVLDEKGAQGVTA